MRVGAAIAGVAVAGLAAGFAADLQRRRTASGRRPAGRRPDRPRRRPDVGPVRSCAAWQPVRNADSCAGVVAGAVAVGAGLVVRQAGEDASGRSRCRRSGSRIGGQRRSRCPPSSASSRPCSRRWGRRGTPCGAGGARRRLAAARPPAGDIASSSGRASGRAQALEHRPAGESASCGSLVTSILLRIDVSLLERVALDDREHQGGELVSSLRDDLVGDLVDGALVVVVPARGPGRRSASSRSGSGRKSSSRSSAGSFRKLRRRR